MRCVLDTNIVVSAMRNPEGSCAALLKLVRLGAATMLVSVALAVEYEAICMRPEHLAAAHASEADADMFLRSIMLIAEPVTTHFLWRPQLRDADDEFVLEVATNGRADCIVTFNGRDFDTAPARFGIEILTPIQLLRRLRLS